MKRQESIPDVMGHIWELRHLQFGELSPKRALNLLKILSSADTLAVSFVEREGLLSVFEQVLLD